MIPHRFSHRLTLLQRVGVWLLQHGTSAQDTLRRLSSAPFATLMTSAAIAITLALPTALHSFTINLKELGGHWESAAAISLFLAPQIDEKQGAHVAQLLRQRTDITRIEMISRQAGLAEFRDYSGLETALDQLTINPLPVVLAVYPAPYVNTLAELEQLAAALAQLPEADFARLDTEWIQRLQAVLSLLQRALLLVTSGLSLGVLLIIGNTMRLDIENRRNEIEVMSLVGATAAFIRRPFLYCGCWYGLFGGGGAWLLITAALFWLQGPVTHLAQLYHSRFQLVGLDWSTTLVLILGASLLGIIGSWIVVTQRLRQLAPRR